MLMFTDLSIIPKEIMGQKYKLLGYWNIINL